MSKEGLQKPGEEVIHGKGCHDTENDIGYSNTFRECLSHTMGLLPAQSNLVDLKRRGWKNVGN